MGSTTPSNAPRPASIPFPPDPMTTEHESDFRRRKAAEFLAHCREEENQARKALADAVERTKRAKEKFETAFLEAEKQAGARILAANSASKNY